MSAVETHLKTGTRLDGARLMPMVDAAIALSKLQDDGFWVRWCADFIGRAGLRLPPQLAEAHEQWESDDPTTMQQ
jgi:hypothetical protein